MRNANGVDREGALAACELLAGASPEEIEALAECAAAWEAPKGAGIFAEREPARGLWILAAGRVKLQHGTPAGREQLVDFADAPCALDVCSFLDGSPLTTSAVAVTDVTVLLVPRDTVLALLERRPQLVWPLVQSVCRDLRRAGLVLTEGRAIELCDIPRMRQIAGCDGCLFECP
jgi:CRP/FNR family transcriptional regulator, cyclic AMP receptor protein